MILIVEEGFQLLSGVSIYTTERSMLLQLRSQLSHQLRLLQYGINDCTVPPVSILSYSLHYSGSVGRPKILLNVDAIEFYRECGYTWNEVADILGVSRSTLWRRLKEASLHMNKYTDISDHDIDFIVAQIQREYPNCGQQMIYGFLKARGICIQRERLRLSVFRTDPTRRLVRWHQVLSRRSYSVKRSNSLWHIDGHHSLIRWRMVIHGGIDGYSRMIVYQAITDH